MYNWAGYHINMFLATAFCVAEFPDSFYGSVHNANQAASYEEAVKAEILASGDNCSRIIFCGAYTAAR